LAAIASQNVLGTESPERKVIMGLAGMSNAKSFATTILNMKNKGLVVYDTNTITLTDKGRDQVGPEALEVPQNNDAMQEKLKEDIKSKRSRDIFDLLVDGKAFSRGELADMLKMENNKSFGTYVSSLSKVSERVDGGKIRLKDIAFPVGRPCDK
jgi:hypothetical protein